MNIDTAIADLQTQAEFAKQERIRAYKQHFMAFMKSESAPGQQNLEKAVEETAEVAMKWSIIEASSTSLLALWTILAKYQPAP